MKRKGQRNIPDFSHKREPSAHPQTPQQRTGAAPPPPSKSAKPPTAIPKLGRRGA